MFAIETCVDHVCIQVMVPYSDVQSINRILHFISVGRLHDILLKCAFTQQLRMMHHILRQPRT